MADHDAGSSPSGDLRRALIDVLERLADIGARPEDSHDDRLREGTLILASVAIALVSFVWVGTTSRTGTRSRPRSRPRIR